MCKEYNADCECYIHVPIHRVMIYGSQVPIFTPKLEFFSVLSRITNSMHCDFEHALVLFQGYQLDSVMKNCRSDDKLIT